MATLIGTKIYFFDSKEDLKETKFFSTLFFFKIFFLFFQEKRNNSLLNIFSLFASEKKNLIRLIIKYKNNNINKNTERYKDTKIRGHDWLIEFSIGWAPYQTNESWTGYRYGAYRKTLRKRLISMI